MADLLPTDVLLVNRAGVDYSVPQSDVMADVLDTDLLLVNRAGVDYNASYADVKKGFGPEKIKPAPADWTTGAAVTGGTGTQVDPFIITAGIATPAGATIKSGNIGTLTGLKANDLIEWTVNAGGDRFKQSLAVVPASGTVAFDLTYADTPASTASQVYNGELQIGTTFFKWDVTQVTGTIDKPAITAPADGAGEIVQAISDTIVAVQKDSPKVGETTLTFATDKDLAKFKALDNVEQDSGYTPKSSAITNVSDDAVNQSFSVLDRSSDTMNPYGGTYTMLFSSPTTDVIAWGKLTTGVATLFELTHSSALSSLEFQMTGTNVFGVKITDGDGTVHDIPSLTESANVSVPITGITSIKKVQIVGTGTPFGMHSIKLNGSLMVDNAPIPAGKILTLTDNTDLDNFRVGDVVQTGVKITAIDSAAPSITTGGGSWSGTDGTSSGTLADR